MTTPLQIPAVSPRVQYVANGSQTDFTYPFPIFDDSDIAVWFNAAPIVSGYSVSGEEQTEGGTVAFDTAPASGTVVTIERRLPLSRLTDFLEGGRFSAHTVNRELDYLTALIQQVESDTAPMLRFSAKEMPDSVMLPNRAARAGKAMAFDGDGNPTVVDTGQTYDVPDMVVSGAGAVTRSLSDKAKDIISAKDFGAVGDGLADDTNAILAALAAHNSVFLPRGTYHVSATIELGEGQSLFGAGADTVLHAADNSFDAVAITASYASLFNLSIENGDAGVYLYGKASPCAQNSVQNITITGANIGIELDGYDDDLNPCEWNTLSNIAIISPAVEGVLLTVSGDGAPPKANRFYNVRVQSNGADITGHGFHLEYAAFNNSFMDCVADVKSTANACFRVGASATKTLIINLLTNSSGLTPNVQLDSGSTETAITNLTSNSDGAAILDNSGGEYMAFNAGYPDKNRLRKTRVSDITAEMQRYDVETVALGSAGTVNADLAKSAILVNALAGAVTLNLPTAGSDADGAMMMVKKIDTSAHVVTVAENGGTGPDGKPFLLGSEHDYVQVVCDGSAWRVIGSNLMAGNADYHDGTGTYKPDLTRSLYAVSSFGGALTVELPPANAVQARGRTVTIKKTDSSGNDVTITEEGATGPDGATQTLTSQYDAITVMSNGGSWYVISKHP